MEDNVNVEETLLEEEEGQGPALALAASVDELGSDDGYCPSEEDLLTDYSSSEENNYRFPIYDVEKEKYDPKLEVGKEFKNIEEFMQAVRNHGVAIRCNFRFRPNDDERAQDRCKEEGCKFKIWAYP
ncbi:DBD Tnp Mut domain-containing protein [Abeliophyllum distichum]|uniref:DBD Tnp Mut domain-containing protein n=1 Tax=Abeliophyllum distichum TaxID=126358 RepID=A0ABD1V8F5_9LAMI